MKDENIKEILEYIDQFVYTDQTYNDIKLSKIDAKLILDCITDLQERKITKEDVDKYFKENMCVSFDKFIENWNEQEEWTNYYRKENKRLKENAIHNDKVVDKAKWNEMLYKSRCKKALEYNNKNIHSRTLNNILRGSDKDE